MSSYYDYLLDTLGHECPVIETDSASIECEDDEVVIIKKDGRAVLRVGKVQRTKEIPSKW